MILPTTNETLRMMATTRTQNDNKPREQKLHSSVEKALTILILKELDFQRRVEALRTDLSDRYDFTVKGAFSILDNKEPAGKLDRSKIRQFVEEHWKWLSEAELDAIIRR